MLIVEYRHQENGVRGDRKNADGDTPAHTLMRKGVRRHWRRAGSWYITEGLTPYDREKLRLLHAYHADFDQTNAKGTSLRRHVDRAQLTSSAYRRDCAPYGSEQ